jgi:hypothetical protein
MTRLLWLRCVLNVLESSLLAAVLFPYFLLSELLASRMRTRSTGIEAAIIVTADSAALQIWRPLVTSYFCVSLKTQISMLAVMEGNTYK